MAPPTCHVRLQSLDLYTQVGGEQLLKKHKTLIPVDVGDIGFAGYEGAFLSRTYVDYIDAAYQIPLEF